MASTPVSEVTEQLLNQMVISKNNLEFLDKMDYLLKNYKEE